MPLRGSQMTLEYPTPFQNSRHLVITSQHGRMGIAKAPWTRCNEPKNPYPENGTRVMPY